MKNTHVVQQETTTHASLTEPITNTTPSTANGKLETVPPPLVGVASIVSPVTGVMGDHRPPGEGPGTQSKDGDDVHAKAHGEEANGGAGIGPGDHLVEMTDIGLALVLLELVAEGLDVGREGLEVKVLDPLVLLFELLGSVAGASAAHI